MIELDKLKPSELIRLAVKDMKATLASGVEIDMGYWGKNLDTPECSVCFAGSVMLQQKDDSCIINREFSPWDSDHTDQYAALDYIRKGDIFNFCNYLEISPTITFKGTVFKIFPIFKEEFQEYETGNEEHFYQQMEDIANQFEILDY